MHKEYGKRMKRLFDLVMEINEKTDLAGFFNIAGHVENLSIHIRPDKIKVDEMIYEERFYYSGELKASHEKFDKAIEDLEYILSKNRVKTKEVVDKEEIFKLIENEGNEKRFTYKGVNCEIVRIPTTKHLCGYLYLEDVTGNTEEVINDNFYCGVTYQTNEKIGFDCAHVGDITPGSYELYKEFNYEPFHNATYKTMDFVKYYLENTIDELIEQGLIK